MILANALGNKYAENFIFAIFSLNIEPFPLLTYHYLARRAIVEKTSTIKWIFDQHDGEKSSHNLFVTLLQLIVNTNL